MHFPKLTFVLTFALYFDVVQFLYEHLQTLCSYEIIINNVCCVIQCWGWASKHAPSCLGCEE